MMKAIINTIAFILITSSILAQQVNYSVRVSQITWYENPNCWEWGTEEYSAHVWFKDNVNTGYSGGNCFQANNNGNRTITPFTTLGSRNNTCAETVTIRFEGWEDDSSPRCTENGGDDCECIADVANINFMNQPAGQWNSYGYYACNASSHRVWVQILWNYASTPDPSAFGTNSWTVHGYNQSSGYNVNDNLNLNNLSYKGYYTDSNLNITSTNRWCSNCSPSYASNWQGCDVGTNNHVTAYKRRGFTCGLYNIDLDGHDDAVRLYVNGIQQYQNDGCCADRGVIWSGYLDGNSTVEFRVTEGGGGSNLSVDFDLINPLNSVSVPCPGNITQNVSPGTCSRVVNYTMPTYTIGTIPTSITSGSGTTVNLGDDQGTGAIPLGFSFNFFGNNYSNAYIASNGYIAFDNGDLTDYTSDVIPNTTNPDNLIALYWEDLSPNLGGTIKYFSSGSAPNRTWTVEFINIQHYSGGNPAYGKIVLHEGSNIIEIHGQSLPSDGGSHVMGIENINGTEGYAPPGRNGGSWSANNESYAFYPITQTAGLASGATYPAGTTTNTFEIEDQCGNTESCSFNVIINDNEAPNANCSSYTANLGAGGTVNITAANINNNSTDNCGITSMSVSPNSFNCSHVGTNQTVTLTVNDAAGNSNTCTATVSITDTNSECCNISLDNITKTDEVCPNENDGTITITATCSSCSSIQYSIGGAFQAGNTFSNVPDGAYTITIRDASNSSCNDSGSITIAPGTDTTNPSISCPANITIPGACGPTVVAYATPVGTDNCPGQTTTQTAGLASGATFPLGTTTNTFTVTDASGNTSSCSFNVIVQDASAPNDDCAGAIGLALPSSTPGNTTGCATADNVPFCGTSNGTGGGLWYAVTGTGNDITASICGSDYDTKIRVYDGNCGTLNCVVGIDDFCGLQSEVNWCSANGTTYYILVHGWSGSEGNFVLELYETVVNPTISCPANITVNNDTGICGAIINYTTPTGADDCLGQSTTQTAGLASGATFPLGTTTNTFVVTDAAGNTATCSFTVTVNDNEVPSANCSPYTANLTPAGTVTITAANVDNSSSDNCGIASMSVSPNTFDCDNIGSNNVTLTVIDDAGNSSTCSTTVNVTDTGSACCDISLDGIAKTDETCPGANDGTITITASCTSCSSIQYSIGGAFQAGNTFSNVPDGTYTITIQDASDNSCNDSGSITIAAGIDTINPAISCPANITVNNIVGTCGAIATYTVPVGTDNCPNPSTAQTAGLASGATYPVGITTNTFTVTDASGNTTSCSFTVTVNDSENPFISCPSNITTNNDNGVCGAVVNYTAPVGTDNCPGQTTAQTAGLASGATFPIGTTTNTFVVTDAAGNTATCSFNVIVNDNEDPQISCPANITVNNDNGVCGAVVNYTTPAGTDNCLGQTTTQTAGLASGATFPIGTTTNTFVVTDAAGNTATCSFDVIVTDNENPQISCPANVTVDNDNGICGTVVTYTTPTGTDNCPGQTTAQTAGLASGATFPIGTTTNTFVVTDAAGNTATCSFDIIVNDSEDPQITCPSNITISNDAGLCTAVVTYTPPTGTDNCPASNTVLDSGLGSGATFPIGTSTETYLVTDAAGNTATCSFTVTINDTEPPVCTAQNTTIFLDNAGNASITTTDIDNGSSDNCGVASLALSQTAFDCSHVGTNTVTLTVTDLSGNTSDCTATVTVVDNTNPSASCQNITVQLDASGNVSITANDIGSGSTDNCTIDNMSLNVTDFTCAQIGNNTVTLTVTDVNGNSSTCTGTVTVEDNLPPTISCPANISANTDAGQCYATVTYTTPVGVDNCSSSTTVQTAGLPSGSTFPVGTTTNTFEVTDLAGLTASCSFDVIITDAEPPIVNCQDATIVLDASGLGSISNSSQVTTSFSDACGFGTLTYSQSAFDCSHAGTTIAVTVTATDINGNMASCVSNVTIVDNVNPTAVCQNITVQLDASGSVTVAPADVDGGSTDNCSAPLIFALSQTTFGCGDVGGNVVTLTITDAAGNTDTCPATITVEDNVPPVATCQNITVQLNASGTANIVAGDVDGGSSDACGTPNLSIDINSFTCANIGLNVVTLTATDAQGNTDNCTATVTIEDNVPPTAICQNITIQLDALGDATIDATDIDNGSNDACGVASVAINQTAFDCSHIGVNNVTLTVTDNNGNVSTCAATVTVEDDVVPVAICQNITVQLDASGNATITPTQIDNGSNDACGSPTLSLDISSFTCANVGTNNVVLTATDGSGNTATCNTIVTVQDNIAPIATCQNITVQLDASGNATIAEDAVNNGSSDPCGGLSYDTDITSFDCNNLGANTVTLTVTDDNGNTATCTATVTIEDNVIPVATCQNITIQLDASGNASIAEDAVNNGSTDACNNLTFDTDINNFNCTNVGANNVVLTVTDASGNAATCTAIVTVEDNTIPTAICQDITIQLDASGNASIVEDAVNNGSTDACGGLTFDTDVTTFDCTDVGTNTVVLTVTDGNGNSATCSATVTVEDSVLPTALCQNITVQLDATGNASITTADIDNGSNDNCGNVSLALDITSFDCSNVGANTVTLTATDDNNNSATCQATVTVQDIIPPTAICQNVTVQLDAAGNASITTADIDNGSNDNCGIASLSLDNTTFTCANVGANTVTLTVTDNNNNVSTCTATVTVQDTELPTAICQNVTVQLDAAGNASITTADIDNGSNDNCGIASLALNQTAFDCNDVGANTVTLTVTDNNGNVSTCTATVTVQDNALPTALCQNITVQLDAAGNATITTADIDNGSNDNCGNVSLALDITSFDCSNVGANTVTLTATDDNNNSATCQATVTVQDIIPPTAICQNVTVQLDAAGNASITTADIDNGSNDNCGIASLSLDNTTFTCANVGANTVTLTVTDNNNNVSTCTATVTVQDTELPTAICQNVTIQLDAAGNASITTADIDNGSNDNCGIASLALNQTAFDCNDVGANTVTLTVTDNNGNVSTCTATVTVEDNIDPSAICQDITVQLDAAGNATIVPADMDNGSADNCGTVSLAIDIASFDCNDIGPNTVTLTVTDANMNTFTCQSIATVEDNVAPTAICQDVTIQLDATGNASITTADIDNGSNDACGIASLDLNITDFDCTDVGANTVSLTVTDNNGNTSICTATVTVQDNVLPTAICQNITVQLDASGNATITTANIDNGSNDNCGIASLALDNTSFNCSNIGANTVILTVTDDNGNMATCTATVTIEDNVVPTAICQDIIVQLDAAGNATIATTDIDNGSSDACSATTLGLDITSFDCTNLGANIVTLTATDANSNSSTCTSTVTVQDNINPVISNCPSNISQLPNTTGCESIVDWVLPTASDNCPGFILTSTHNPMDAFPLGTTTVTYTLEDASGNTVTCSFDVEISGTNAAVDINVIETSGNNTGDGSICNGDVVTLDAGVGYSSYAWSTGQTGQSITATTPGVYIVTVSNGFGCTASDSETITILEEPIASLTCPDPELNECQGRFNCRPNDLNSNTLPIVTGSFSGSAAPYIIGNGAPGSDTFIDFNNMPKDIELELIYTITTADGCSDSISCTFLIESKKANPGRF